SLRFPALAAAALIAVPLHQAAAAAPSLAALAVFAGLAATYVLAVDLLWLDPLIALRQRRSLPSIWRRHLADGATVLTALAETCWAYCVVHVAFAEGALLAILMLLPLIL